MRAGLVAAALGGALLVAALIGHYGWSDLARVLATAGWPALAALAGAHLVYWGVCGLAWHALLPTRAAASVLGLIWARWVRDAGSDLLPISSLGGDLMGARAAVLRGLPAPQALASTVVDVTLEIAAQLGFTLIGLALLMTLPAHGGVAGTTLTGLAVATPLVLAFVIAQRVGLFLLLERAGERLATRWRWPALGVTAGLHDAIRVLYRDKRRLGANLALHLIGWSASAAEAWLGLALLGAAPGVIAVLVIESLSYALRSAAFVVPAALGVQEGGYVLLGPLFGIPAETMLALALLKRARDLVLGLPALAVWQWIEGARWGRRA